MNVGNYGNPSGGAGADASTASSASSDLGVTPTKSSMATEKNMPDVVVKEKAPTPSSALVDALENGIRRDVNELDAAVAPVRTYKERLQDANISFEYARHVLETLITNGTHYAEDVKLTPTLTVRFRTRMYMDTMRVYDAIEKASPRYADTTDSIQMRYMLAASLEGYGLRRFSFPTDTTDLASADSLFHERLAFLYTLSELAVRVLAREFGKFDRKLNLVLSDGAVEAF